MKVRRLAESLIMQSVKDLWSERSREKKSIEFFSGDNFSACAKLAGVDLADQIKILSVVKVILRMKADKEGAPGSIGMSKDDGIRVIANLIAVLRCSTRNLPRKIIYS